MCKMLFSSIFNGYDKIIISTNTIINRSIGRFRVVMPNFIVMFSFFMTPVPNNLFLERKSRFATYIPFIICLRRIR